MDPKRNRAGFWLAAVIAVLFIVPWTRSVLLVQLGLGLIPTYSNRMLNPPHVAPKVAGNLAQALAIGRRDVMKSKSILVYRKLIDKYPNEPALYANLLRYASMCGPFTGPGRPEIDKPGGQPSAQWKPYADSPELRMAEDAIEKGRTLDPDNAYFDFFDAVLRFGQKRDSEALAAIHRAAGKRKFDAYTREENDAVMYDVRRSIGPALYWISPTQRVGVSASMVFPQLLRFRQAALMADWYVRQDAKSGRSREALAITADLVNAGGVMRDSARWAIDALVGISIQQIPVRGLYESLVGTTPPGGRRLVLPWEATDRKAVDLPYPKLISAVEAKSPDALSPAEWQAMRDDIAKSQALRDRIKACFASGVWDAHMRLLGVNTGLLVAAGSFLVLALMFGVLWLIARTWLARGNQGGLQSGPGRLSSWLLALLPSAGVLTLLQAWGQTAIYDLFGTPSGPDYGMVQAVSLALKVLMVVLVLIIAAVGIRRTQNGTRFDGFLARLRTGSVFAIQGLLALYLVTMIINIPLTACLNRDIDRWLNNEMHMVQEYNPPAK